MLLRKLRSYFSGLSSIEAKSKYEELKEKCVNYLKDMEVSQHVIERMFQTGSTEIDIINADDANKIFGMRSPFYEEWLTAKCGKFTKEQIDVIDSLNNLQAARATVAIAKDNKIEKSDDFGTNFSQLIEKSQLALQMEKAGMIDPYIKLSKIHKECEDSSANTHVVNYHRSVQKLLIEWSKDMEVDKNK